MAILRDMEQEGWRIILHCAAIMTRCTHSWAADWPQLIQYLGPECDLTTDRRGLSRMVCTKCGGRGATVTIHPPLDSVGLTNGAGSHSVDGGMTLEESVKQHREFMADRRRLGYRSYAELNAEARQRLKAVERAKCGDTLIGPPDPRKYKRGRWLRGAHGVGS